VSEVDESELIDAIFVSRLRTTWSRYAAGLALCCIICAGAAPDLLGRGRLNEEQRLQLLQTLAACACFALFLIVRLIVIRRQCVLCVYPDKLVAEFADRTTIVPWHAIRCIVASASGRYLSIIGEDHQPIVELGREYFGARKDVRDIVARLEKQASLIPGNHVAWVDRAVKSAGA